MSQCIYQINRNVPIGETLEGRIHTDRIVIS